MNERVALAKQRPDCGCNSYGRFARQDAQLVRERWMSGIEAFDQRFAQANEKSEAQLRTLALIEVPGDVLPAPLAAVGVVSLLVIGFQIDLPRVGDLASIEGGLPTFHLPQVPLSLETLYIILPYSLILAAIGLIESLLTLNVVADMTETKGDASRECLAQGVANTVTGFFGGMGGCAMIGQSMINITSGGRGRLSGITAGVFLLLFIAVGWPLIKIIEDMIITDDSTDVPLVVGVKAKLYPPLYNYWLIISIIVVSNQKIECAILVVNIRRLNDVFN